MDNVPPEFQGRLMLDGGSGYDGPTEFSFAGANGSYTTDKRPIVRIPGLRYLTPGIKFIRVEQPDCGISAWSNAVEVSTEPLQQRLFWGDLHAQTFFSDGLRCPEELYAFARSESFLDVFALSDHSESLTDRQWEYFTAVTNDAHEDGAFVTLVGQEWTSREFGHRNVYYPGNSGPILRSNDGQQGRLDYLYKVAERESALVVPHHSANAEMGVDWSLGHAPDVERLVEVHSVWGNSECPAEQGNPMPIRAHGGERAGQHVVDALRRGYRFGLVGGGDIHDGRPGDELHSLQEQPEGYRLLHRQGITGIWADELTRPAILDALRRRRVFATTNVRVLLRFAINGHPMGSEIRLPGKRTLTVDAASESSVALIEIVRNGKVMARDQPNAQTVSWEVHDDGEDAVDWYYVRLRREDGQMVWSSPIWVERG